MGSKNWKILILLSCYLFVTDTVQAQGIWKNFRSKFFGSTPRHLLLERELLTRKSLADDSRGRSVRAWLNEVQRSFPGEPVPVLRVSRDTGTLRLAPKSLHPDDVDSILRGQADAHEIYPITLSEKRRQSVVAIVGLNDRISQLDEMRDHAVIAINNLVGIRFHLHKLEDARRRIGSLTEARRISVRYGTGQIRKIEKLLYWHYAPLAGRRTQQIIAMNPSSEERMELDRWVTYFQRHFGDDFTKTHDLPLGL